MIVETVKIAVETTDENPLGYVVINKSDQNEEHTLFEEESEKKDGKTKVPKIVKEGE